MSEPKKYLTIEEAAAEIQMPPSTLRRKITAGELVAYKPGKKVIISAKELELFIKRSKIDNAS